MNCPCDYGTLQELEVPVKNINQPVKGTGKFMCDQCGYTIDTKK